MKLIHREEFRPIEEQELTCDADPTRLMKDLLEKMNIISLRF